MRDASLLMFFKPVFEDDGRTVVHVRLRSVFLTMAMLFSAAVDGDESRPTSPTIAMSTNVTYDGDVNQCP